MSWEITTEGQQSSTSISGGVAECKPIPYEDIALERDVMFLRHYVHHTEENVSGGAPKVETRYYAGFFTRRDGLHFCFVQFSLVGDGPPSIPRRIPPRSWWSGG
jgi:hypothetical protein